MATEPRPSASVIVLRGGAATLEVLLVQRSAAARFMPGAWVFPGGAVDPHEGGGDAAHRAAAVRELEEEASVRLEDPAALIAFSRWITPRELPIRFDTYFFLAALPDGARPEPDGSEIVDLAWHTPAGALAAGRRGELELFLPTVRHLEQLAPFESAQALLTWAPGRTIVATEPEPP